jgi:hypothetical protein
MDLLIVQTYKKTDESGRAGSWSRLGMVYAQGIQIDQPLDFLRELFGLRSFIWRKTAVSRAEKALLQAVRELSRSESMAGDRKLSRGVDEPECSIMNVQFGYVETFRTKLSAPDAKKSRLRAGRGTNVVHGCFRPSSIVCSVDSLDSSNLSSSSSSFDMMFKRPDKKEHDAESQVKLSFHVASVLPLSEWVNSNVACVNIWTRLD